MCKILNMVNETKLTVREQIAQLDNLTRPDGSAVFCQGKTTVQSAVYGPTDVQISKELIDKANLEVIYRPITGQPGCTDRALEKLMRNTMESVIMLNLHPHTAVTINIQAICNAGSLLSCCINSACLAVLDAGLSMKYFVASTTCAITKDGEIITDPDLKQEQTAKSIITTVIDSKDKGIISMYTSGQSFKESELKSVLRTSKTCCEKIFDFYKQTAQKRLSKQISFQQISESLNQQEET